LAQWVEVDNAIEAMINEDNAFEGGSERPLEVTVALPEGWKPGREYRTAGLVEKLYESGMRNSL
jgi:hypothetical protein